MRQALFAFATLCLGIVLAACGSDAVTAPGTAILEWDRSKSERDNIQTAKPSGKPTAHKKLLQAAGEADKPFAIELDFETLGLDVIEDGKSARHTAVGKTGLKAGELDSDDRPHMVR